MLPQAVARSTQAGSPWGFGGLLSGSHVLCPAPSSALLSASSPCCASFRHRIPPSDLTTCHESPQASVSLSELAPSLSED